MHCYHDVIITGISHDSSKDRLVLQTETETGEKGTLEFIDVAGWDLSPFSEQNILFDLQEFDAETLPDWIEPDLNIPKEYLDILGSGVTKLFYLDASIGMGGYIVASSLNFTVCRG